MLKVLVVDDEEGIRALLDIVLTRSGKFEVELAKNGVDALTKIQAQQFDVVLTDVYMPWLDGYALCRVLRDQMGSAAPVLVIMTTSRAKATDAGADYFLPKPFSLDAVAIVLESLARERSRIASQPVRQAEEAVAPVRRTALA